MNDKIKTRITLFYVFGAANAVLGVYTLLNGLSFVAEDTARTLAIVFFVFTVVNFYSAYSLKKRAGAGQIGSGQSGPRQ